MPLKSPLTTVYLPTGGLWSQNSRGASKWWWTSSRWRILLRSSGWTRLLRGSSTQWRGIRSRSGIWTPRSLPLGGAQLRREEGPSICRCKKSRERRSCRWKKPLFRSHNFHETGCSDSSRRRSSLSPLIKRWSTSYRRKLSAKMTWQPC